MSVLLLGALAGVAPVGATHAAAPTIALPHGSLPAVALRPPPDAPAKLVATSRDCGFSVELSDGAALWVFCDTADTPLSYFRNSTAALAFPDAPTTMREPTDGAGRPYQLVTIDPADDPCVGEHAGEEAVEWPTAGARVPGPGGTDRVLISFQVFCFKSTPGVPPTLADYTGMQVGMAELLYDPDDPNPLDAPLVATVLDPAMWPIEYDTNGKIVTFGNAIVTGDDGYLYSYRCGYFLGCQVARAPVAAAADPAAYTYWTGLLWQATPPALGTVGLTGGGPPMSSFRIVHLPEMGVYAMAYAAFPGAGTDVAILRVSHHPWGPFSTPLSIVVPDCADGSRCYSGAPHSQLSGTDHVGVSLYDTSHPGPANGAIVTVVSRVDIDPPPTGVCRTGFPDVWHDHPFCVPVDWASDGSLVLGYADGTFRPGAVVSRQAVASWLWRAAGSPGGAPDPGFDDVPPTHPFHEAIAWLADSGITAGYPDGTFRPASTVTRQAAMAWFHRRSGDDPGPFPPTGFSDVPATHPFALDVAWAVDAEVTDGYSDGTFRPTARVTRQAFVAWLHRTDG